VKKREEAIIGYRIIAHQAHPARFVHEASGMIGGAPENQGRTGGHTSEERSR